MKVLFFTTAYDPQMEVQVVHQEFLQRLRERGHQVSILASQKGSSRGAAYVWEQVAGIPLCRFTLRGGPTDELLNLLSRRFFHYDGFLTILRRYLGYFRKPETADVVHVESAYPLGAVAALARRRVRIPYVITVRGADLFNEPGVRFGYARYPLVRSLLRLALRNAAATRATTFQTQDIVLSYGAAPQAVRLIPRNIRDECFPTERTALREAARREIVRRHQLPERSRILVAAGRLLPIKGFDLLLRALPAVVEVVPDATLFLCGATRPDPVVGDYQAYLERLAGQLGIQGHLVLTGELPASLLTRYLAAADLVVVSSIREGSNKVLLEAAALGTPFVATTTSGTNEFFRDPPGGVEVPPGDVDALAGAIRELLSDEARRRALGQQAAEGSSGFRSDRVADEMLRLYAQVLAGQHE